MMMSSSFSSGGGSGEPAIVESVSSNSCSDMKPDSAASSSSSCVKPDSATTSSSSFAQQEVVTATRSGGNNVGGGGVARILKNDPGEDEYEDDDDEDEKPAAVVCAHKDDVVKTTKNRVLVEFKFRSYKTQLFKEGGMQGTLHLEMDQDPVTGIYSIPVGETPFSAHLDQLVTKTESWCMGHESSPLEFSGKFTRKHFNGPVEMESGLVLDYFTGNHRDFKTTVSPPSATREYPEYKDYPKVCGSVPFTALGLSIWERNKEAF
jgi:hypothetical protein